MIEYWMDIKIGSKEYRALGLPTKQFSAITFMVPYLHQLSATASYNDTILNDFSEQHMQQSI